MLYQFSHPVTWRQVCFTAHTGHRCALSHLGYRCDHQRLHASPGVVALLLREPRVNDVDDPINGQRGFCDVGCQDNLTHTQSSRSISHTPKKKRLSTVQTVAQDDQSCFPRLQQPSVRTSSVAHFNQKSQVRSSTTTSLAFVFLYFVHFVVPKGVSPMGNSGRFPQGKPAATVTLPHPN